ncbi:MAG: DUF2971 domain-containing protein [Aestuariivirga sp.]|nr:DUF2971 domain-containing protein [Aestuariivirga sp.]
MYDPEIEMLPADLKAALLKFEKTGEETIDRFTASVNSFEPPDLLYHYTDDKGLKGVLETGNLWFTDIFNLNDPSEIAHGFRKALELLDRLTRPRMPIHETFLRGFTNFVDKGGLGAAANFFTCSFSLASDDLGQWRAYADNGKGYALGFDAKELDESFMGDPKNNPSTFLVTYNDAKLDELFLKIINAGMELIALPRGKGLAQQQARIYMVQFSTMFSVLMLNASLYFKHEAYKNEEEFRFLQTFRKDLPPNCKTRSRPYSLVKYREVNWKKVAAKSLRRIVIGPAADITKARQFAEDCCKEFYASPIEIIRSKIPYRAS